MSRDQIGAPLKKLVEVGPAKPGVRREIILAVGPAFGTALTRTIGGLEHEAVLEAILTGVAQEGLIGRIVKVKHTSDCAAIGQIAAELSGSGIGIGLQSRGTAVIHKKGLARLNNLELFPQSPSLTLETYRGNWPQRRPLCAGRAGQAGGREDRQRRTAAPDRQDDTAASARDGADPRRAACRAFL